MAKTMALFFILGLMVSCASNRGDRSISSLDQNEPKHGYYERSPMGYR
jgi:hypothetical protein